MMSSTSSSSNAVCEESRWGYVWTRKTSVSLAGSHIPSPRLFTDVLLEELPLSEWSKKQAHRSMMRRLTFFSLKWSSRSNGGGVRYWAARGFWNSSTGSLQQLQTFLSKTNSHKHAKLEGRPHYEQNSELLPPSWVSGRLHLWGVY